ncbi:sugar nucleotide-binding protein [Natronomonas sp. F2-12]|uniref:Sugar nucleotide-binding protein n=1 Tax=Natronomonas aquatica TaxID=2841590 RepID=A0A9R1CST0_9EURY|nr:sugar nucleotide-binding protein [Natronomonas aquatica]
MTCEQLNITDSQRFEELLSRYTPDVVINCAAMTDVDTCEKAPETAQRVNEPRFRDVERLQTNSGRIRRSLRCSLGDMMHRLLAAGE